MQERLTEFLEQDTPSIPESFELYEQIITDAERDTFDSVIAFLDETFTPEEKQSIARTTMVKMEGKGDGQDKLAWSLATP